ncbi:MAG: hypothetical protein P4L53_27645 [Candidatus Obscuribacterales bacterium]|nr:hypothetical protein [Candidatus Obscuribacterales bacterium]
MNSKKQTPASQHGSAAILIACLLQIMTMPNTVLAQSQAVTTTSVTTKSVPLVNPVSTTTTTTVVKKRSPHLKRRRGKTARKISRFKTTTVTRTNSALSGGVAKTHKHHAHVQSTGQTSSAQQTRSNKLDAFLKNPPKMKKTPYFNPPGLDVPSSPAL